MTIPVVPYEDPDQGTITTPDMVNPFTTVWWAAQTITGVPEVVMGWLVANGWQITGLTPDTTTNPPTMYYALSRQGLQSESVLLSLCNSYTVAANDAKWANEFRYNEILTDWQEAIASSQAHFEAQVVEQNTQAGVFMADLDTFTDQLEVLVAEITPLIDAAVSSSNSLASQCQSEQDAYETVVAGILADIQADYDAHGSTAPAYLTGLGTTELARINEQFAASLSVQLQDLVDRGLYSSAIATDITARNTRDRDAQIQALNDRLNREKLENQHLLYKQQFAMRLQLLGATDRAHSLALDVLKYRSALVVGNAQAAVEARSRAIAALMDIAVRHLDGLKTVWSENQRLMAYQLDERNKLLIGLYGFVERREDIAPEWKDMATMIAGLSDSGGGWLTP